MNAGVQIPVFALGTVLFPNGRLSLRVFEPRYLDMVKACMSTNAPFAVCLVRQGTEVGDAATVHGIGCTAQIIDFDLLEDGLLGITAEGVARVRITATRVQSDQLIVADVVTLPPEPDVDVPLELNHLAKIAKAVREQMGTASDEDAQCLTDATWVGHRLAESLPLSLDSQQSLLELNDPIERLRELDEVVHTLAARK